MFSVIALINHSTLVPADTFGAIVKACNIQLSRDVSVMHRRTPTPVIASDGAMRRKDTAYIAIVDDPDQADALGYHSEDRSGNLSGFVFVKPVLDAGGTLCGDRMKDPALSVSAVVSHEVCELFGDAYVNLWAEAPNGNAYAVELCDQVQDEAYAIAVSGPANAISVVFVSNFLLPAAFDDEGRAPFDFNGSLKKPFSLSKGGYCVVRKQGGEKELFGEVPAHRVHAARITKRAGHAPAAPPPAAPKKTRKKREPAS